MVDGALPAGISDDEDDLIGSGAATLDLRQYFHDQRRWFFGLLGILVAVSVSKDVVRGALPGGVNLAFHAVFATVAVAGFASAHERLHRLLAYGTLSLFAAYIALLFAEL